MGGKHTRVKRDDPDGLERTVGDAGMFIHDGQLSGRSGRGQYYLFCYIFPKK